MTKIDFDNAEKKSLLSMGQKLLAFSVDQNYYSFSADLLWPLCIISVDFLLLFQFSTDLLCIIRICMVSEIQGVTLSTYALSSMYHCY